MSNPVNSLEREDFDPKKYLPVTSLPDLIEKLYKVFESDLVNIEEVEELMNSYKSNPVEWEKFAKFDPHRYTRNLIDAGNDKFNLMLVCWEQGHASPVHDHSDSHCFMKMLQGTLNEVRFAWPEGEDNLKEISRSPLPENNVCYINDSLGLHLLESPNPERAVSMHLYCPPFSTCQVFDKKTGKSTKATSTFWSKFGEKVN